MNYTKPAVINIENTIGDFPEKHTGLMQQLLKDYSQKLINNYNNVLEKALIDKGFDPTDKEFINKNISCVILESGINTDRAYYAYYGATNQVRIITFTQIEYEEKDGIFSANFKYY